MISEFLRSVRFFHHAILPKAVYFAITNDCNGRCSTCRFPLEKEKRYVAYDDVVTGFDMLYEEGVRFASITGGEPLLHPDLLDICKYMKKRGILVSYIPTNGIAVTEEIAKGLKDAEVNIVGISVDPLYSKDALRTRKVKSDRANLMRARSILEKEGVQTYAGILITKHLLPLRQTIDLVKVMGFSRIVFSYPQTDPSTPYRASSEHELINLNPEYVEELVEEIKLCKRAFPIYNPDETLADFSRFYKGLPQHHMCLGGNRLYYVDWDLNLYRCFADPRIYGNVLSLDKLPCEEANCTACTQQAFREMSYVLNAYDRLHNLTHPLASPEGNGLLKTHGTGSDSEYLKTLFRLYTGGFFH